MRDVPERRLLRAHLDEPLARIGAGERAEWIHERLSERHGDRRENAARHRKQVRREDEVRGCTEPGE